MNARLCNSRHTVCKVQSEFILESDDLITPTIVNNYLNIITTNMNYNNCLNKYTNSTDYQKVFNAYVKISAKHFITPVQFIYSLYYIDEDSMCKVLQNQLDLEHDNVNLNIQDQGREKGYCNKLIDEKFAKNQYSNTTNIILAISTKKKLFTLFLNNLSFKLFIKYIVLFKQILQEYEIIIANYIKNINITEIEPCIQLLIDIFSNKSTILYELYPYLINLKPTLKKDIIDKTIANLDRRFLIKLLDYDYSSKIGNIIDNVNIDNVNNVNKVNIDNVNNVNKVNIINDVNDFDNVNKVNIINDVNDFDNVNGDNVNGDNVNGGDKDKVNIDIITITNMLSKVYIREIYGAVNNKLVADIMDILIDYNIKITKEIIMLLLSKGCYINNIERNEIGIVIDTEILEKCSDVNYYPYDFNCIPTKKVMLNECARNNINILTMLKEKGGIIDIDCLNKAVYLRKNSKIIKYIISNCKIKPNEETIKLFQEVNNIECFDLLINNYNNSNNSNKDNSIPVKINCLDTSSLLSIEPITENFEIDYYKEYVLRTKIKILLNYKKNNILYNELEKLILKYLIDNKLIIGNYFILNHEISTLIRIDKGVIMHIDQLKNILPYFISTSS
jgi:hypothetical protein